MAKPTSKTKTKAPAKTKAPSKKKTAPAKKAAVKTAPARKAKAAAPAKQATPARKPATPKPATPKPATPKPAPTMAAARDDYGAPIDSYFPTQPPHLRPICEALRTIIEEAAPDATSALKWGRPVFSIGTTMICGFSGFKAHVGLNLAGPPGTFSDPKNLLEGGGTTGRHVKIRTLAGMHRDEIFGWVKAAADVARNKPASD